MFVCMSFMWVYGDSWRSQTLDPLELELEVVVSLM